jgi:hypothetical protein
MRRSRSRHSRSRHTKRRSHKTRRHGVRRHRKMRGGVTRCFDGRGNRDDSGRYDANGNINPNCPID